MAELSLHRLVALMEECGDRDSTVELDLDGDIEFLAFEELGFDSLALFNTSTRIEREYSIELPLDAVLAAETPGGLLKLVNDQLGRIG